MARVWVTGAAGLIGGELMRSVPEWCRDDEVIGLTRTDLDLKDHGAIERRFRKDDPEVVIHCAALSRPVDCERDPATARRVNVDATRLLADLAADRFLIYLSTDLVMDGRKGNYLEEDPPNPLHLYGETKLAGEECVRRYDQQVVLRAALNFGTSKSGDRSFNEQMHAALATGRDFTLFADEYRCPLATPVTVRVIWEMARLRLGGLYMLGGAERVSRWEIGKALYERWGKLPGTIRPGSLKDYDGPPRPADLSLNSRKVQSLLSFQLPGFHEWLAAHPEARV